MKNLVLHSSKYGMMQIDSLTKLGKISYQRSSLDLSILSCNVTCDWVHTGSHCHLWLDTYRPSLSLVTGYIQALTVTCDWVHTGPHCHLWRYIQALTVTCDWVHTGPHCHLWLGTYRPSLSLVTGYIQALTVTRELVYTVRYSFFWYMALCHWVIDARCFQTV
jgi:hypothetical protein